MGRKGKKSEALDLLNFTFSSSPPSQSQMMAPPPSRRTNNPRTRQTQQPATPSRISELNRTSARRKPASSMFYLHSSADHAFVITRRSKQGSYSFAGPDTAVPWEAVRTVKFLVPCADVATRDGQVTCPICLDAFTCPRITKCGHCFCLPCLLRHVHSSTEMNKHQAVKCPCCSLPIHLDDFRLVTLQSVLTPRVQSKIKLVKLHRTKDCSAPYLPRRDAYKHSSPHMAPVVTDQDASFSRFNYVDPAVYQAQLAANQAELETQLAELQQQSQSGELHPSVELDRIVLQMASENVRYEQGKAVEEYEEEKALAMRYSGSQTGMYQAFPERSFAIDFSALDIRAGLEVDAAAYQSSDAGVGGSSETGPVSTRVRANSMGSRDVTVQSELRQRGNSISSADETRRDAGRRQQRRERRLPELPATMYLDEDSTQFYQSSDGQLCFLSRFNMSCLLAEFSVHAPESITGLEDLTQSQRRKLQPLPDEIEGTILEIESVHLTTERRKRMPFLSHLPIHTDIVFVELDLNSILSDSTKQKFKAELEKRRKRRKNKIATEKKADRLARKQEERRIEELKSRIQHIDPNDDFFQAPPEDTSPPTGDDFGPALAPPSSDTDHISGAAGESPPSPANPALSFSAVAGRGFSVLSPAGMTEEEAFPSLMSSQTNEDLTKKPAATAGPPPSTAAGKGRKSKGKKIVLFSTGGHRGPGL